MERREEASGLRLGVLTDSHQAVDGGDAPASLERTAGNPISVQQKAEEIRFPSKAGVSLHPRGSHTLTLFILGPRGKVLLALGGLLSWKRFIHVCWNTRGSHKREDKQRRTFSGETLVAQRHSSLRHIYVDPPNTHTSSQTGQTLRTLTFSPQFLGRQENQEQPQLLYFSSWTVILLSVNQELVLKESGFDGRQTSVWSTLAKITAHSPHYNPGSSNRKPEPEASHLPVNGVH